MSEKLSDSSRSAIRNNYFTKLRDLKAQRQMAADLGNKLGGVHNRCSDLMGELDEIEADAKLLGIDISDSADTRNE